MAIKEVVLDPRIVLVVIQVNSLVSKYKSKKNRIFDKSYCKVLFLNKFYCDLRLIGRLSYTSGKLYSFDSITVLQ
jgi:hypothetical protein